MEERHYQLKLVYASCGVPGMTVRLGSVLWNRMSSHDAQRSVTIDCSCNSCARGFSKDPSFLVVNAGIYLLDLDVATR